VKKTIKIALTGGIASGKTLVSDLLKIHGCHIIDLDIISREVVLPGTEGLKELVGAFGDSILLNDGTLNRGYLRDKLYKKDSNRVQIEKILHPKILQKMKASMDACKNGIMVVVIPLLVEKKLWEPFDRAIVVDCSKENQISRLMAREKIDKERAEFMLLTQSSRKQRLKLGDKLPTDIIENDSRISDLKAKIDSLSQKLFSLL